MSLEKGSPTVLLRDRPHLVETFTFEYRQPYHTAEKRSSTEARGFVSRVRTEARLSSYRAIHSVQVNLQKQGYELKCCGLLLSSGRTLPDLPQILASHALIHAANRNSSREALLDECKRCERRELFTANESELIERAVHALHLQPNELQHRLTNLRPLFWFALDARRKARDTCCMAFALVEHPDRAVVRTLSTVIFLPRSRAIS